MVARYDDSTLDSQGFMRTYLKTEVRENSEASEELKLETSTGLDLPSPRPLSQHRLSDRLESIMSALPLLPERGSESP